MATMNTKLIDAIGILLSEDSPQSDYISNAIEQARRLEDLRCEVDSLSKQLVVNQSRMVNDFALNLRRKIPSLNISISRGTCNVGYKKYILSLTPDIKLGVWRVKSDSSQGKFSKQFMQRYGSKTTIAPDMSILADSIASFFKSHYKTLGEDLTTTGILLIEGKRANIKDLLLSSKKNQ